MVVARLHFRSTILLEHPEVSQSINLCVYTTDEHRRMSREYRDSVVRRRSKKGNEESSQDQMEVEAIVADIEATGARPKSRGSKGSLKKRPESGRESSEQLHHGVARETIAKYLEDIEDDDFEFVEGSVQAKGQIQGEIKDQGKGKGQEWDWSWVDLGEKGLEEHVIPIVMVSSETEPDLRSIEEPVSFRRIPIRVEDDAHTVCLGSSHWPSNSDLTKKEIFCSQILYSIETPQPITQLELKRTPLSLSAPNSHYRTTTAWIGLVRNESFPFTSRDQESIHSQLAITRASARVRGWTWATPPTVSMCGRAARRGPNPGRRRPSSGGGGGRAARRGKQVTSSPQPRWTRRPTSCLSPPAVQSRGRRSPRRTPTEAPKRFEISSSNPWRKRRARRTIWTTLLTGSSCGRAATIAVVRQ